MKRLTDPKKISKRTRRLLAALLTGLCLVTPWNRAEALTSYTTPNGLFRLDYYDEIYSELTDWQKQQINVAADYWDGLLKGTTTAKQSVALAFIANPYITEDDTARATPYFSKVEAGGQNVYVTRPNAVLNHGTVLPEENDLAGFIEVGANVFPAESKQTGYDTPLPQSGRPAMTAGIIHEMGHAMGIASLNDGNVTAFREEAFLYDSHLYDWRGRQARPGMEINTQNHGAESEPYFDMPESYSDWGTGKYPYFSGRHVSEVLDGAKLHTFTYWGQKREWKVPGLPLEGILDSGTDNVDFSHIELRNGLMGHQSWRNYVSFMEAELALLQDLGYTIDRRDYFGRSIYGDGQPIVNDSPFYARNADGTAYVIGAYNENPYGMGLHIYGSQNTVFQNAPLMTKGMGAVGIRVDGAGNCVTVNKGVNVQADGVNGNGILVAYGKDHKITLAQGSRVTAAGEGGIGAAFDFGQNILGNAWGARASYAARYRKRSYHDLGYFLNWLEIDGPLVTEFTVQGELSGKKAAIDISDNAFVKNIHIGTGAKLSGDIVSRWAYDDDKIMTVSDGIETKDPKMQRWYGGDEELTTRLAFEGTGLAYDGNITGADNMRLNVSGDLVYGGRAQLLFATVEKGG
ncbi:MAG: hypothetical protein IKS78_08350, partial [Clostridia bacterium]|nr:hypothetical protein [Clostridia bacterium]